LYRKKKDSWGSIDLLGKIQRPQYQEIERVWWGKVARWVDQRYSEWVGGETSEENLNVGDDGLDLQLNVNGERGTPYQFLAFFLKDYRMECMRMSKLHFNQEVASKMEHLT
jgi:hypothetical protein